MGLGGVVDARGSVGDDMFIEWRRGLWLMFEEGWDGNVGMNEEGKAWLE